MDTKLNITVTACIAAVVFLLLVVIFTAYSQAQLSGYQCIPMTEAGPQPDGDDQVVNGRIVTDIKASSREE